ncbi:MAG: ketoacyl-ACP synthase III [Chloroherpetonaceae bacterium]|nr:ketoacyl-ACP synthase III [Chloroherpetonaceae bacterium]MDW8437808.1 ketoacyl-ACP synthase III [Chloroherpetonaceae bacterium]
MRNAVIASSGFYAPERVVPNQYFNELLGEDVDTWLVQNLTIRERRWAKPDESTADLVVQAAQDALRSASLSPEELDLIIVATDTPEYISPSTASVVQHRLGARKAGTFDINAACAGFVTALDVASKFIRADERYERILVVGAYAMSKYLDPRDKKTVTLFADGAGAMILSAEENSSRGYLASELLTEGQYHDWMGIYAGGTHQPITPDALARKDHLLKFVRKFPKELNPEMWTRMIRNLCERLKIQPRDVAQYFFTQININSIWETLDRLGEPREKAHAIMDRFGYTGSACIPMAFHDAVEKGKIKRGDLAMFIGSGGGLAFASAAFRY